MSRRPPATPPSLEKRAQPGRVRAIVLAVAVHAAFFALIIFGVNWQSSPPQPVQAELWDKLPPAKVPAKPAKAEPARQEPKPEPPKPEVKPEPPKPEAKPEPPKPAPPDPAIALRLEREKKALEKRERLEKQKAEERRKHEQEEAAKKKREQEEAAKKKAEDDKRRKAEEAAREAAERAAQEARTRTQAEVDKWRSAIQARIRSRANVPDTVTGNPELVVRIRLLPGGEVLDLTIVKRSGNAAYDAAIERGIRSASPLPVPPANSELFPQFRELTLNFRHER